MKVKMRASGFNRERVFFVCIISCALLLVSIVTLRSELASHSNRVFRDGFIVANRDLSTTSTPPEEPKKAPCVLEDTNASKKAKAIELVGGAHRTTTIKTEDGDEITIKRASSNKNKITRISADEDGKITIENHDHQDSEDDPTKPSSSSESPMIEKDSDSEKTKDVKVQSDTVFEAKDFKTKTDSTTDINNSVVRVNMDQKKSKPKQKDQDAVVLTNPQDPQTKNTPLIPDAENQTEEDEEETDADHVVVHLSRNLNRVTIQEVKDEATRTSTDQ